MTPKSSSTVERVLGFCETLKHSKGKSAGSKFYFELWQREAFTKLFGNLNKDGKRIIRTALFCVPRKNGKSFLAALCVLVLLVIDGEMGAEIYSAAADREQASIVFNQVCDIIKANRTLSRLLKIRESRKTIYYPAKQSVYRALSAESGTKLGFNASAIVCDELQSWKSRELLDVLTTSMGSREQPLTIMLMTAGYDRDTIGYETYEYGKRVRDGLVDDPTFLREPRSAKHRPGSQLFTAVDQSD